MLSTLCSFLTRHLIDPSVGALVLYGRLGDGLVFPIPAFGQHAQSSATNTETRVDALHAFGTPLGWQSTYPNAQSAPEPSAPRPLMMCILLDFFKSLIICIASEIVNVDRFSLQVLHAVVGRLFGEALEYLLQSRRPLQKSFVNRV